MALATRGWVHLGIFDSSPQPATKDPLGFPKEHLTAHLPVPWLLWAQLPDSGGFITVTRLKITPGRSGKKTLLKCSAFHIALHRSHMSTFSF